MGEGRANAYSFRDNEGIRVSTISSLSDADIFAIRHSKAGLIAKISEYAFTLWERGVSFCHERPAAVRRPQF